MFERLLVAVDGSESSFNALRESLQLARGEAASVTAISVIPAYEGELRLVGVKNISETMRGPYEKALARAEDLGREFGLRVSTILAQGEAHEIIAEIAETQGFDVIVVGVRGYNPVETVLMGSMTARIIGYSSSNVLVVPMNSVIDMARLLVAVDGSELGKRAVRLARDIRASYGSHVTILSVADVPPELYGIDAAAAKSFVDKAKNVLKESVDCTSPDELTCRLVLREGDPATVINDFARLEKISLILIGSHGRTGIKRLLMGSVAERVISHAACPVLVTRTE